MEPFVYLAKYQILVCTECKVGCIGREVSTHLRTSHTALSLPRRKEIAAKVALLSDLIQDQEGLQAFPFPCTPIAPISFLEPPQTDGLRCTTCHYIAREPKGMQRHCRSAHGWENDCKRGGHMAAKQNELRMLPYTSGIHCQRFFRSRRASGWFEVLSNSPVEKTTVAGEACVQWITRIHTQQRAQRDANLQRRIEVAVARSELSSWVYRTGWARHLQGLDPMPLRDMVSPIREEERTLALMWATAERVFDQARAVCHPNQVGRAVLFEIYRNDPHVKPSKPFETRMEEHTWTRYKGVFCQLLCFWWRSSHEDHYGPRPPYQFTSEQEALYSAFAETACEESEESLDQAEHDQQFLAMFVSLFRCPLQQDEYENPLLSGLAVLGIQEDGSWVSPVHYTWIYAAVIKVARIVVVYQAYLERKEEVRVLACRMPERKAYEQAVGLLQHVRTKTLAFMTRVAGGPEAKATVMDWLFDTLAYGRSLARDIAAPGTVDWVGDRLIYGRVQFTMGELSDMLHTLVDEARALLGQLTYTTGQEALPAIDWARAEDDHSEARVGHSFLTDNRNAWLAPGQDWLVQRIARSADTAAAWFQHGQDAHPYQPGAVKAYGTLVETMREKLWLLLHMVGGQPARGTEMMALRYQNTQHGVRDFFLHRQSLIFVTRYQKTFHLTGQHKIVYRAVPREIGELLVWYLWLVLPFWQEVQSHGQHACQLSAFLWASKVVLQGELHETPAAEPLWTTDRARQLLKRTGERLLGTKLTIREWRQVAIAISNRYLHGIFGPGEDEGDSEAEDEGEAAEESVWHEQAGHSMRVGGMLYARELQQATFGTASQREKFLAISQKWHRFLGFGASDLSALGKRKREPYEGLREEARLRRFVRLQQVNLGGQLRMLLGPEASFRGKQASVLRAIVQGETPIVQIAGTGEGKSLSFLLPAFCSPEGTTIVIVPLVSLRDDLLQRCQASGIRSCCWQGGQANTAASLVFVTPESALTKSFQTFVSRLQGRQALDRVVVDECHILLDSLEGFRTRLQALGPTLQTWGVQQLFLTATLAPRDEAVFFRTAGLAGSPPRIFRSRTTRKNIAYRVHFVSPQRGTNFAAAEDAQACRFVRQWQDQGGHGRAIVYVGSIARVEALADTLGCARYHSKVDTAEGKTARLQQWLTDGQLIVATSALGQGLDVPDVRLVVHAGMPRRLRDYVQESGRAGRDSQPSQAVVVCGMGDPGQTDRREADAQAFLNSTQCRRVLLDEVMDGFLQRDGCENGEAACDLCQARADDQAFEADVVAATDKGEAEQMAMHQAAFQQREQATQTAQWLAVQQTKQTAKAVQQLRAQLADWVNCCVVCRVEGAADVGHCMADCPRRDSKGWQRTQQKDEALYKKIFLERRLGRFSGCFFCGFPQALCQRWQADPGDEGSFQSVPGGVCQYQGLLCRVLGALHVYCKEEGPELVESLVEEAGHPEGSTLNDLTSWLGLRVQWGELETNRYVRFFSMACVRLEAKAKASQASQDSED